MLVELNDAKGIGIVFKYSGHAFWIFPQFFLKFVANFHRDEAKKFFFWKKKIQNGRLKKPSFSKSPILNIF